MHRGLYSFKYIIFIVKLLVSFLFMNILVDLNSVAGCSCKDHLLTKKLSPHDEQLTVDGVMNDDENREQTLDQSTNVRHTQTPFNVKYTADIEERASPLDDSPNVTIYDNLLGPIRISRSLTPELRIQVPTPTPGNQFYPFRLSPRL